MTVLLDGTVLVCPNCDLRTFKRVQVAPGEGTAEFHHCPALGILAPLVPEGTLCKVEKHEREDYEGLDAGALTLDQTGRPIASVVTTRENGQDCAVFAPVAKVVV